MMQRHYNYSDEVLLEYASITISHFKNDFSLFNRFDRKLNEDKKDELEALIRTAYSEGSDELNVGIQQKHTENMWEEMARSRLVFNQVRYWVMKVFPHRKAIQRQFGIGRFSRLSDSQPRLVEFMHKLAETVDQYWEELKAAGAPEDFKREVEQQATSLAAANLAQEQSKGHRMVDTEDRIERLNLIFDFLRLLNRAAEFVFADEPAKREFYRPPSRNLSVEGEMEDKHRFLG